jgi:hypothetical protein
MVEGNFALLLFVATVVTGCLLAGRAVLLFATAPTAAATLEANDPETP